MYRVQWNKKDYLLRDNSDNANRYFDHFLRQLFEDRYPGFHITGDTLTETYPDDSCITHIVYCGNHEAPTPVGMCRDRGDHFILARANRFDRIDKHTLNITINVDDD